jgi:tRNA pseudouridine38-40 synthase
MVRNLVGMFLLLGKGTLGSADIPRILRAASRATNPAATAPASGLYMASVEY